MRWGRAGKPGLCFVHGGFAHAHWWDWIAPFYSDAFTVAALDLGGMGDSGHRAKYSLDTFAKEVATVCAHAGLGVCPVTHFEDLGFARIDHHRSIRQGFPEVIYGQGKLPDHIAKISKAIVDRGHSLLVLGVQPKPNDTLHSQWI